MKVWNICLWQKKNYPILKGEHCTPNQFILYENKGKKVAQIKTCSKTVGSKICKEQQQVHWRNTTFCPLLYQFLKKKKSNIYAMVDMPLTYIHMYWWIFSVDIQCLFNTENVLEWENR